MLQRDYWAVISRCRLKPSQLIDWVARRFPEFAPVDRAVFSIEGPERSPRVGDEFRVKIRAAGTFRVRVLQRDANSVTLGTLRGHPEAGRITFGSYRNSRRDVIFHIRSRARSSGRWFRLGFMAMGDPMQVQTWADFITSVARSAGDGVIGYLHSETCRLPSEFRDNPLCPTFVAQGD